MSGTDLENEVKFGLENLHKVYERIDYISLSDSKTDNSGT